MEKDSDDSNSDSGVCLALGVLNDFSRIIRGKDIKETINRILLSQLVPVDKVD